MKNPKLKMRISKEIPDPHPWRNLSLWGQCRCWMGLSLLLCFISLPVNAQIYAIGWWTIAGGGGTSTGGVYQVRGTLGQPDAGVMTNSVFTLRGGFWGGAVAVQTPDAPYLSVTSSNAVVVVS